MARDCSAKRGFSATLLHAPLQCATPCPRARRTGLPQGPHPPLHPPRYPPGGHLSKNSQGEPQRFRLGPAVAQLAHAWSAGTSYETVAQATMRWLWKTTRETVSLHVQESVDRVCVAELPSTQPLSFRRGVGYREKLVRGASGRSILAWLHVDARDLPAYGAASTADAKRLTGQLQQCALKAMPPAVTNSSRARSPSPPPSSKAAAAWSARSACSGPVPA